MKSGLMDSEGEKLGTDLLDQQFSVQLSGMPGGLTEAITRQLSQKMTGEARGSLPTVSMPAASTVVNPGANQSGFVSQHTAAAERVAQATGIPAAFMVGQAGHDRREDRCRNHPERGDDACRGDPADVIRVHDDGHEVRRLGRDHNQPCQLGASNRRVGEGLAQCLEPHGTSVIQGGGAVGQRRSLRLIVPTPRVHAPITIHPIPASAPIP